MTAACVCSEQRAAAGSLGNLPLIPDNEANGPKRGSQTPASPSSQAHGSSARALANTSKLGIKKKKKTFRPRTFRCDARAAGTRSDCTHPKSHQASVTSVKQTWPQAGVEGGGGEARMQALSCTKCP